MFVDLPDTKVGNIKIKQESLKHKVKMEALLQFMSRGFIDLLIGPCVFPS